MIIDSSDHDENLLMVAITSGHSFWRALNSNNIMQVLFHEADEFLIKFLKGYRDLRSLGLRFFSSSSSNEDNDL